MSELSDQDKQTIMGKVEPFMVEYEKKMTTVLAHSLKVMFMQDTRMKKEFDNSLTDRRRRGLKCMKNFRYCTN